MVIYTYIYIYICVCVCVMTLRVSYISKHNEVLEIFNFLSELGTSCFDANVSFLAIELIYIYIYIYIQILTHTYIRGVYDKFPKFFSYGHFH